MPNYEKYRVRNLFVFLRSFVVQTKHIISIEEIPGILKLTNIYLDRQQLVIFRFESKMFELLSEKNVSRH